MGRVAVGAGSDCFRLFFSTIELADRVRTNLPQRVLHDCGLFAFAVLTVVGRADERAFD